MKRFVSLKAVVFIAAASMAFAGSASAFDHDDEEDEPNGKDVVIGIIGQVLGQAAERKEQKELERRCQRWNHRCEEGSEWACERYENSCDE